MMKNYLHFYPTCPCCHEPHINGTRLVKLDSNLRKCSSCHAIFHQFVDITPYNKLCTYLRDNIENEDFLRKLPLLWDISTNIIENSYIEWLNDLPQGKYIITWPWKNVKFIPVLLSEFLFEYPEKRAVVIGNAGNGEYKGYYEHPKVNELFSSLIYIKNPILDLKTDLKREMNKFDRKDVLIKDSRTYYVIRKKGSDDSRREREENIFDGSPEKCMRTIFKELEEAYGKNCVRKYKRFPSNRKPKIINPEGIFDVTIGKREEWTGRLNYNRHVFWKALFNSNNIRKIDFLINNQVINSEKELNNEIIPNGIIFISESINSDTIFEKLASINPDLIIIENFDEYIKDQIYRGTNSRSIFKFLSKTESTVMMFSTNPDVRHLFNVNSSDSILDKYNINIHTWDSGSIMEKIKDNFPYRSHNAFSSTVDELPDYGKKPVIEYQNIENLDKIDTLFENLKIEKIYHIYIKELKKSPLQIKGDYNSPEIFRRMIKGSLIHYNKLISSILRNDKEAAMKIIDAFDDLYRIKTIQRNPVLEKILKIITELISEEKNVISVIVHGMDVKGTGKLLIENGLKDHITHKIDVLSWKKLGLREIDIENDEKHYVISTRQPSFDYQLYFSKKVDKFIFLGSERDIERTRLIIENRLTEENSRPLLMPGSDSPELLKNIAKKIRLDKIKDELPPIVNEKIESYNFMDHVNPEGERNKKVRHMTIKKGDEAVLALDGKNNAIFIPLNKRISFKVKNKDTIEEINIKKELLTNINNKEIILDRQGVYTSFKHIFTKFMFERAKKIEIKMGIYAWDNFEDLFKDSIVWISVLRQTMKKMMKKSDLSETEAEEQLARYLVGLDLNAKNKDYVKKWWSEPEIVITERGSIPIYDIEHPRSIYDLIKIYNGIKSDLFEDMDLKPDDAERTFIAARTIQNMRRRFFKNEINKIPSQYRVFYEDIKNDIRNIIQKSDFFKVKSAIIVRIGKDINSLQKINQELAFTFVEN